MGGHLPIEDPLILSRGADYVNAYEKHPQDPAFPPGTTAAIEITKTSSLTSPILATWPAENVSPTEIDFWVQSELTDLISPPAVYRLMVYYPPAMEGAEQYNFCWYRGPVQRIQ